jgi:transposase InsO family protein
VCLSFETGAFSREIVGYHVDASPQTGEVAQPLKMTLRSRRSRQSLIHHSDRAVQYCASDYQQLHAKHGLICSITVGYDCYQNALAERINGILKTEDRDLDQAQRISAQSTTFA